MPQKPLNVLRFGTEFKALKSHVHAIGKPGTAWVAFSTMNGVRNIQACCLFIICLSLSVFPLCKTVSVKMGGQLDKRMLYWQPAKCIFQLFIIICYLANKVLLLLLLRVKFV